MKIDRRKFIAGSSSALVLAKTQLSAAASSKHSEELQAQTKVEGRAVKVYTTADKTEHRISATSTLTFKPMGQPLIGTSHGAAANRCSTT